MVTFRAVLQRRGVSGGVRLRPRAIQIMRIRRLIGLAALTTGCVILLVRWLLPVLSPDIAQFFLGLQPSSITSNLLPEICDWTIAFIGVGIALLIPNLGKSPLSWLLLLAGIGGVVFWATVLFRGASGGFPVVWSVERLSYGGTITSAITLQQASVGMSVWLAVVITTVSRAMIIRAPNKLQS